MDLWGCYGRDEILGIMLGRARDLGLRPSVRNGSYGARAVANSGASEMPASRVWSREERERLYGRNPLVASV
jgi:hypothetical protein